MRIIVFLIALLIGPMSASVYAVYPLDLTAGNVKFEPAGYRNQSFTLTNRSTRPVYYDGYALDSPIWNVDVEGDLHRDRSKLENDSASWCGMGLAEHRLGPHQSVSIIAPVPDGSAWRLGVPYSLLPGQSVRPLTAWSVKLAIPSPIGERNDASKMVRLEVSIDAKRKFPYTFTLTNISNRSLYYGGYTDAPPLYINEYWHWSGWIDDGTCDWCGKGLGFQPLAPGQVLSFTIPAQNETAWRIGLALYRTPIPTVYADMYNTVWWPKQPGSKSK